MQDRKVIIEKDMINTNEREKRYQHFSHIQGRREGKTESGPCLRMGIVQVSDELAEYL